MTDKTSQVSSQCSAARGGRCLPKMPWQGGGKEGCVRLHCQEPGVVELLVHLEARQTNSRLFSTLSLTCTAFQETRHMLSGQPQLEYHGAGTRYAVPDLPYKCHLCHKKFRDMGGMMQHQVWKKSIEKNKFLMQLTFQDSAHNVVNRRLALC